MNRVPLCPHAAACGGCPFIDLPYPDQLARKLARVRQALQRFPRLTGIALQPVAPAEPVSAYRTRSKLVVGRTGVGLYGTGSHALVDLPGCQVVPAPLAAVIARVRSAVAAGTVPVHVEATEGIPAAGLRALDIRGSAETSTVLLTLITDAEPQARAAVESLGRWLLVHEPAVAGVFVSLHTHGQPRLLGGEAIHVAGATHLHDLLGATRYVAGPGAFVQSHRGQAALLHALVAAHLPRRDARVLDVYGGGGGIGVALAAKGARVTLVESYAPSVADARASAARNGVSIEAVAADAARALAELTARGAAFDLVVVNPPRRGCDAEVREALAAIAAPRVAYVSCDPDTLARDLDHLAVLGYRTRSITPVDMIPLTAEVENVALLARAAPAQAAVLWEGGAVRVVDKSGGEPADPHPERSGSLRGRVRTAPGWQDARTVLAPDESASGVAVVIRDATEDAPWRRTSAATPPQVTWVVLVRGITSAKGTVRRPMPGSPDATMRYRRSAVVGGHALLEVTGVPSAGVVRRLLASLGHPVAGDVRHGHAPTNRHLLERHGLTRAFLHASAVTFVDPRDETEVTVSAPLPGDLDLVLSRLKAPVATVSAAPAKRDHGRNRT